MNEEIKVSRTWEHQSGWKLCIGDDNCTLTDPTGEPCIVDSHPLDIQNLLDLLKGVFSEDVA